MCAKVKGEPNLEYDKRTLKIVDEFVQLYLEKEEQLYKLHYLSFIITYVPFSKLQRFLPSIVYQFYQKELELSKKPKTIMIKEELYVQRWSKDQINSFVEFITKKNNIYLLIITLYF